MAQELETLKAVIMRRDGLSEEEAEEEIAAAKEAVVEGEDPEQVLEDYFGLEPDYVFDLLD